MGKGRWVTLVTFSGLLSAQTPECSFLGQPRMRVGRPVRNLSAITGQVTRMRSGPTAAAERADGEYPAGSIDAYIFADLKAHQIAPAPRTTDWEFIRRVTLDLTGRIPAPDRVLSFVSDTAADKRAKLIDELLARPEWVDKWTMYFGDLYQNTALKNSTTINRSTSGRTVFYQWTRDSLAAGKPYNQMVTELLTANADNSNIVGASNLLLGGVVTGGPVQDIMDQMTANVFETFLGIEHVNCLLCHNGRGHLDSLSLWGTRTTRYQAWQLASFLSHTSTTLLATGLWSLQEDVASDYALNTTTGNRPARQAPAGCGPGDPCSFTQPEYFFSGDAPKAGESYRAALARNVTGDFQFARAAVNYIWEQMFGRGIVDPPNSFDPARLDPDHPPPDPWKLQPSNPRLLNALAQRFIESGYNLKAVMREIAISDTYQLSSRYEGEWNPEWEPYFARKFVRRLWGEEVHDAVAISSGIFPSMSAPYLSGIHYAMQLPETTGVPTNDANTLNFLDAFLRGNRDDQPRREEGSAIQALTLMNSAWLDAHLQTSGSAPNQLILQSLAKNDTELVRNLFLTILSRYPSAGEMDTAKAYLGGAGGNQRVEAVQDLVWSLYNKVDFVFNY